MRRDRLVTAHLPWWHSCDLVPGSGTDSCSARPGADLSVGWLSALQNTLQRSGPAGFRPFLTGTYSACSGRRPANAHRMDKDDVRQQRSFATPSGFEGGTRSPRTWRIAARRRTCIGTPTRLLVSDRTRSEEHTSEPQSLMRSTYAAF